MTKSALEENAEIGTEVGDRSITISRHDDGRVTAVDEQGRSYSAVRSFWFAWFNFHPDTERI